MVNIIAESVLEKKKEIRLRTRCWILIRSSLLYTHSLLPSSHKYQSLWSSRWVWSGGRVNLQRQGSDYLLPLPISHLVTVSWPSYFPSALPLAGSRPIGAGRKWRFPCVKALMREALIRLSLFL